MKDLKIDLIDILHNEDKKQEAVWMLNKIGYKTGYKSVDFYRYLYACGSGDDQYSKTIQFGNNAKTFRRSDFKEITVAELRGMVNQMKEYLNKNTYEYKLAHTKPDGEWVEIPDGAEIAIQFKNNPDQYGIVFYKNGGKSCMSKNDNNWQHDSKWTMNQLLNENYHEGLCDLSHNILWQRPTQPEALPFIDDNPQSLNEQYAEIEQVRQSLKDNVNHPSHYTKGKVECLDALESATIGKSGIEAVCVANIIKYLWRYEEKNGLEDIKKANFYLNRLIATLENNNG